MRPGTPLRNYLNTPRKRPQVHADKAVVLILGGPRVRACWLMAYSHWPRAFEIVSKAWYPLIRFIGYHSATGGKPIPVIILANWSVPRVKPLQ